MKLTAMLKWEDVFERYGINNQARFLIAERKVWGWSIEDTVSLMKTLTEEIKYVREN